MLRATEKEKKTIHSLSIFLKNFTSSAADVKSHYWRQNAIFTQQKAIVWPMKTSASVESCHLMAIWVFLVCLLSELR